MAKVPGFLANLTLDGNAIITEVQSTPLTQTRTALSKGVMDGTPDPASIGGKEGGTLNIRGFVSQEEWNLIEVTWDKNVPVPFILTVTEGLVTDAAWAGEVTLTTKTVDPVEDGAWEFSLDGDISGPVTFTPSAVV